MGTISRYNSPYKPAYRKKYPMYKTPRMQSTYLQQQVKKVVKSTLNRHGEMKCFPIFSASAAVSASTTGVFTSLSQITQGVTNAQRIGNDVELKRIRFHMTITPSEGTGSDNYNRVRVIIFKWKEDDAANPVNNVTDILDNSSSSNGLVAVDWPYNFTDRADYSILFDQVYTLNPIFAFNSSGVTQTDWASAAAKTIRVNKALTGGIQFNGSDVSGHGKIYLLVVSDSAVAAHPTYGFAGQILYKDA